MLQRHALLFVALLAAIPKLIVFAQLGGHPLLQPSGDLDSGYYLDLARRVQAGDWVLGSDAYFVSPLYVYYLGAVFTASDGSLDAVRIVQIALGAAAVWLIGATARIWFSERAAVVAALLAAACGLFTFYEILILQAALDPFLTALGLFLVSRAVTTSDVATPRVFTLWGAAGFVLGLHALNRPNVLPYALVVAILAAASEGWRQGGVGSGFSRNRQLWGRAAGVAASVIVAVSIALAPVTLRNYAVTGELVPISSHGGLNFYIGNNPNADGTYHGVPGITPSMAGQVRDARRVAEQALGRQLGSGEVSSYFYALARDWIVGHPGGAVRLLSTKLAYLLNATPLTLNYSYTYYSRDESSLLSVLLIGPAVLIPLGLVGLFLHGARARRHGFWIWGAFVPVYGLSVAAFFISSRYRLPLLVPFCVASAGTIDWLWTTWRAGRRRAFATALAVTCAFAVLANWNLGLDDGRSEERTQMILSLMAQGRDQEAASRLPATLRDHPLPGVLYYRIGRAMHTRGRLPDAIASYERALAIDNQPEVRFNLGQVLVDAGRPESAVGHLEAACAAGVRVDRCGLDLARAFSAMGQGANAMAALKTLRPPEMADGQALYEAGDLALQLGDPRSAERFLVTAALRAPESAPVHEKLGVTLSLQGRHPEALFELELAVRLDPNSASSHLNLAVEYAQQGRKADAHTQVEAALTVKPDYEKARQFLNELQATETRRRR